MAVYTCRVKDGSGRIRKVRQQAVSEEKAVTALLQNDLYPLLIRTTERYGGIRRAGSSQKLLSEFTDTIALLLSSGLTLKDSLEVAADSTPRGRLRELYKILLKRIDSGRSLAEAVRSCGIRFPRLYEGLFRIGEKLGSLEGSFRMLSSYYLRERALRDKLISALIYPAMVLTVAFSGVVVITVYVLPRVTEIFTQLDTVLPVRIESIITSGRILLVLAIGGVVLLGGLGFLFSFAKKRNWKSAAQLDRIIFKIPVIGSMQQLRENYKFTCSMEALCMGGYSLEEALLEASFIVSSGTYRSSILSARKSILKGGTLADSFIRSRVFPQRLSSWIMIGERSGNIEGVFCQLRRFFEAELEKYSARFIGLIEPVLILILGAAIITIIVLFVMPILSLYGSL
ncbi:MAG: type II secretion system F family protein [Spirochaetes bacterium]|nr:type II secretion system F family protein [Spirochaetota bacterium]